MKAPLELKILFPAPKRALLGLHLFVRGCLPVRPVLAILCMCVNGSNDSVLLLHLPTLLHVAAGTPVPVTGRASGDTS